MRSTRPFLWVPLSSLLACVSDSNGEPVDTIDPTSSTSASTSMGTSTTMDPSTTTPTTSGTTAPTTTSAGTDDPSTSGGSSGGSTGGGGNDLDPEDLPGVGPCPEQDILRNAAMLEELKTALTSGTITYLDVPFDAEDPDIYAKKCGFEEYWNPSDNVDEISWASAIDPTVLTMTGNSGICGTSSDPFSDPAFPSAGTYRKEMRIAYMASTYHLRWRVDASGTAAGQTYSSNGITVSSDGLASAVDYTVDGTASSHDDLFADIVGALGTTGQLPSVTVTVAESGGDDLFSADITLLCATVE